MDGSLRREWMNGRTVNVWDHPCLLSCIVPSVQPCRYDSEYPSGSFQEPQLLDGDDQFSEQVMMEVRDEDGVVVNSQKRRG